MKNKITRDPKGYGNGSSVYDNAVNDVRSLPVTAEDDRLQDGINEGAPDDDDDD